MKPKRRAKPKGKLPTIRQDIARRVESRAGARYADVAHVVTAWRDGIFSHAEAMYRIDDIINGRPT